MQFQVPQFIEVEDKIFGPLTFKQFVYLAGGAGLGYVLYRALPIYLAAPFIALFVGLGVALAFFQYNGQPFIVAIENSFFYFVRSKLYLWSNEQAVQLQRNTVTKNTQAQKAAPYIPQLSTSKLHELSWSLDINERIAAGIPSNETRDATHAMKDLVAPVRTSRDAIVR